MVCRIVEEFIRSICDFNVMMILKSYFSELVVLPFFWFIKISKVGTKVTS
jgi:hypothetical protein